MENNPRWVPGFLTGIYTHKKFAKTSLSESPVGFSSENSPASGDSEEQKRLIKVYQTESGDNKMITLYKINQGIARTTLEVRLSMNMNMNFWKNYSWPCVLSYGISSIHLNSIVLSMTHFHLFAWFGQILLVRKMILDNFGCKTNFHLSGWFWTICTIPNFQMQLESAKNVRKNWHSVRKIRKIFYQFSNLARTFLNLKCGC